MKRDIAIFTVVKNESYFLKKWIQYYSQFFDLQDMLVLNNNGDDGCINNIHIRTQLLVGNHNLDWQWLTQHVRLQFETLLHDYKYVMYVDVDEFIVPTHNPNLRSYIEQQINTGQHSATNEQWHSQHQRNDAGALLLHAKLFDMQYTAQRYQQVLHQFSKFEPGAPISDHLYIIDNQPQQFLDYHFPQRFNGSVHHLSQLIHYDYTHLF